MYFSIRSYNISASQKELLYELLTLCPAILVTVSLSILFSAVIFPPSIPVCTFSIRMRLGKGCMGYLHLLYPIAVGVRAEESSLLVSDLQE